MIRKGLVNKKIIFLSFVFLSSLIWVYRVFIEIKDQNIPLKILFHYNGKPLGQYVCEWKGKISPLAAGKLNESGHRILNLELDKNYFNTSGDYFIISKALKTKLGPYQFLNGKWAVSPDTFHKNTLLQKISSKKKVFAYTKIHNPDRLCILKKYFSPDSVWVLNDSAHEKNTFTLKPFFLEVKEGNNSVMLYAGENIIPTHVKFYLYAERYVKVAGNIPIDVSSGWSINPKNVKVLLMCPRSWTDSLEKKISAKAEIKNHNITADVYLQSCSEHIRILDFNPKQVKVLKWLGP
ncbi:MAG: hypothetical protein N3F09_04080 [Bacteroidia bacterium]|nr:hypothetical protein [Bacteroidia bacterium]